VVFIVAGALARQIYDRVQDTYTWPQYQDIASKIQEITPANQEVFTNGSLYFLTKRRPLPGMEFEYSHKLNMEPAKMAALHVMPDPELKRLVAAGTFYSAATCSDSWVEDYELEKVYKNKATVHDCPVFWEPKAEKNF
jgi:hypothetical protein